MIKKKNYLLMILITILVFITPFIPMMYMNYHGKYDRLYMYLKDGVWFFFSVWYVSTLAFIIKWRKKLD